MKFKMIIASMLITGTLCVQASAESSPTAEQLKDQSGARFSESSGSGATAGAEQYPVSAAANGAHKSMLAAAKPQTKGTRTEVPEANAAAQKGIPTQDWHTAKISAGVMGTPLGAAAASWFLVASPFEFVTAAALAAGTVTIVGAGVAGFAIGYGAVSALEWGYDKVTGSR